QQQQQQQQPGPPYSAHDNRRESPAYDPLPPPPPPNGTLRSPAAVFPRLSSFSISQSNVRAENTRAPLRGTAQPPPEAPDRRFVLPVSSVLPQPVASAPRRFLPPVGASAFAVGGSSSGSSVASAPAGHSSASPSVGSHSTSSPRIPPLRQQMSSSPPRSTRLHSLPRTPPIAAATTPLS
ncbi:hypothetical protein IWQ57_005835, partial [Coemansia nantahalensis]